MDGIDLALCRLRQDSPTSPLQFKLLKYAEEPVPASAKATILDMIRHNKTSLGEVCQVNFLIGKVGFTRLSRLGHLSRCTIDNDADTLEG